MTIKEGDQELILKRKSARPVKPIEVQAASERIEETSARRDGYVSIRSPIVGTFYRRPSPDEDPYVEVGDRVEDGDTVCIIEAMKVMNEIEADCTGIIANILVEDAQPVEYGQELFLLEPIG